jgi:hypothetical protein
MEDCRAECHLWLSRGEVRYYIFRFSGIRPYDLDGNPVTVEECFNAA